MPQALRWPARIVALAVVLALCASAGWQLASPAGSRSAAAVSSWAPSGSQPPAAGAADLRSPVVGTWDELGGSGVVLNLAADGVATFDLRVDGALAWTEVGTFTVVHDAVTVTCLLVGPTCDGYEGLSTRETYVFRHGLLVLPADGDVFTRQG